MPKIVECVPNFSEGRRPEVYNTIAGVIGGIPGVHVLDISADSDHNRSVITFVGSPEGVEEAAVKAIGKAASLIDLDQHQGEHPRIGATDVFPFIPVQGVTVDECVALARRVGKRVGDELGIAVYLYGSAATRPERTRLSDIRKGQYELWKAEIGSNPERDPDFGPAVPKPWGATVIGVRPFLIAYNLFLDTGDVSIASEIARAIRFSSGGLRYVQALGFLVEGQAQVSMNLTDFSKTPIHRVQEMVKREAELYGVKVTRAELIGLIPEEALLDAAKWYLQLNDINEDQVLELRLAKEQALDFTPYHFLEATAAGTPTPGGGSTAALAGALAASLSVMVANLTIGRKKYAAVDEEARRILTEANELKQRLTGLVLEDSRAFELVMTAFKDKDKDAASRDAAIEQATIYAGEVPLSVAELSTRIAQLAQEIILIGNLNAITDAGAGAIMARSAVQIAALNVRINAKGLKNQEVASQWITRLRQLEKSVDQITEETLRKVAEIGEF